MSKDPLKNFIAFTAVILILVLFLWILSSFLIPFILKSQTSDNPVENKSTTETSSVTKDVEKGVSEVVISPDAKDSSILLENSDKSVIDSKTISEDKKATDSNIVKPVEKPVSNSTLVPSPSTPTVPETIGNRGQWEVQKDAYNI